MFKGLGKAISEVKGIIKNSWDKSTGQDVGGFTLDDLEKETDFKTSKLIDAVDNLFLKEDLKGDEEAKLLLAQKAHEAKLAQIEAETVASPNGVGVKVTPFKVGSDETWSREVVTDWQRGNVLRIMVCYSCGVTSPLRKHEQGYICHDCYKHGDKGGRL